MTGERRSFKYDNLITLAELHYLYDHLGYVPTSSDFEEHGEISIGVYKERFGSYPRVAGFDPVFVDAQEKARYLREYEELVDPEDSVWMA